LVELMFDAPLITLGISVLQVIVLVTPNALNVGLDPVAISCGNDNNVTVPPVSVVTKT